VAAELRDWIVEGRDADNKLHLKPFTSTTASKYRSTRISREIVISESTILGRSLHVLYQPTGRALEALEEAWWILNIRRTCCGFMEVERNVLTLKVEALATLTFAFHFASFKLTMNVLLVAH
jgi:hypothetical protein